jgi:hypothetical protein
MTDAHRALMGGAMGFPGHARSRDRLPVLQAVGLILAMSLGVWGVIGLGLSLVVG